MEKPHFFLDNRQVRAPVSFLRIRGVMDEMLSYQVVEVLEQLPPSEKTGSTAYLKDLKAFAEMCNVKILSHEMMGREYKFRLQRLPESQFGKNIT